MPERSDGLGINGIFNKKGFEDESKFEIASTWCFSNIKDLIFTLSRNHIVVIFFISRKSCGNAILI